MINPKMKDYSFENLVIKEKLIPRITVSLNDRLLDIFKNSKITPLIPSQEWAAYGMRAELDFNGKKKKKTKVMHWVVFLRDPLKQLERMDEIVCMFAPMFEELAKGSKRAKFMWYVCDSSRSAFHVNAEMQDYPLENKPVLAITVACNIASMSHREYEKLND